MGIMDIFRNVQTVLRYSKLSTVIMRKSHNIRMQQYVSNFLEILSHQLYTV